MTISTFERNATIAEMAVEIDRRGAVIERLEAKISRLTSPPDGVGLTRYGQRVAEFDNAFWVEADKDPEGEWVRHDDATAALAAKETSLDALSSELDTANREIGNLGRRMRGYYERAEKAEAERDALKAALAPFAEALDEDDFADERLLDRDEIWEHPVAMRITFKHLRDAKRAALWFPLP